MRPFDRAQGRRGNPEALENFSRDGYAVVRGLASRETRATMVEVARAHLDRAEPPVEYEADVQYPGSPQSRDAAGGRTVRRLLQAYARHPVFAQWAVSRLLAQHLRAVLGRTIELSQSHHNCIMTKHPRYGSSTSWHRDIRYWSFERPELVSAWLALGPERVENGCLLVLPGSHAIELGADRLDPAQFLLMDTPANAPLIASQVPVELEPGDVLFFHSRLFHAAGRNRTADTKLSVVFTYHAADNKPLPGSRSASLPDVPL